MKRTFVFYKPRIQRDDDSSISKRLLLFLIVKTTNAKTISGFEQAFGETYVLIMRFEVN
jgi:hypothetical protein